MLTTDRFLMVDTVRARRRIEDSPLSAPPAPAARGSIGSVEDIDGSGELVFVDFGRGAIACAPDELAVVAERPRCLI